MRLDQGGLDPLAVAQLLQKIVEGISRVEVLVGKQSIDGDHGTTAPMLAELLGWSQATFAASLSVDGGTAEVEGRPMPARRSSRSSSERGLRGLKFKCPRYPNSRTS